MEKVGGQYGFICQGEGKIVKNDGKDSRQYAFIKTAGGGADVKDGGKKLWEKGGGTIRIY